MSRALAAFCLALFFSATAHAATITILPGAGFNDSTTFTPVGGNNATTLGQARLNLFQKAASIWAQRITSAQTIFISVKFTSLTCSSTQGILGQASPNFFFTDFANAPKSGVYYPEALANSIAGSRLDGHPTPTIASPDNADISADFNSAVDSSSSCLGGKKFYYGFDNVPGSKIDLLNTVVHEFGHGLGFTSFVDESTGNGFDNTAPSKIGIYDQFVFDETRSAFWPTLTASQRVSSATNTGHLVWNGTSVNGAKAKLTAGVTAAGHVQLYAPNPDEPGSSVSHWSDVVAPHLLMEPFDSSALKASLGVDFTICAYQDMGWQIAPAVNCPDNVGSNTAPVAVAQSVQTNQNTNLPITLTATDAENDPLTFSVLTAPTHGGLSGTAPNLTYVPSANFFGADSFQFVANDGKVNSASATVSITVSKVNHPPVATPQSVSVLHDHSILIALSGTDADNDALTFSVVTAPAHGSFTGTAPRLTYKPSAGFGGADSFTFKANDGTVDSAAATVSITVIANRAPVAGAQSVSATQDTAKSIVLSATDADGDTLTYSFVQPAHGSLSGAAPNLTYTPATGYSGADSFSFKANDGLADSNSATVSITVAAAPAPAAGGGGGGGAMPNLLCLIALAGLRRLRLRGSAR
jgi:hypothetical protein